MRYTVTVHVDLKDPAAFAAEKEIPESEIRDLIGDSIAPVIRFILDEDTATATYE